MATLTNTYLLPAILLNPVLLLHTLNTIVSRLPSAFPSIAMDVSPLPRYGPHATLPYLDVHANDNLCWSYTAFMVGVQLLAFGRVSGMRRQAEAVTTEENKRAGLPHGEATQGRKGVGWSYRP
ncbi:MAG: hypothetical protein M1838_005207 [Thelocarpon superellum]|nr:MAG: hypothetical protein M1838_005207 [Thelocarpon superellum]